MTNPLRLCLVLHNHQPVGNFEGVIEQAYRDSYLPFLDVFEPYGNLKISLHTSGPLMEWLDARHGDYLNRLASLVQAGRIEIVGGPFYEPILTMIPARDRVGQIRAFTSWLENRLGAYVQGMWMPERVWEQNLTSDIVAAGIKYTVLDDFHFKNAGLGEDDLYGYYLTEDDGRLFGVFPGSERLRYLIPFARPEETIDYLRSIAEKSPNAVVVFGDDGEKFGTWPDTRRHVYDDGWLRRFFEALSANADWLRITTLSEAVQNVPPLGKVYLPDASYREMTEWALPVARQVEYDEVTHAFAGDSRWPRLKQFVRGGFWRNFKMKYSEANEMYARMMMVSRRLADAEQRGIANNEFKWARQCLYRGQCNCAYWHGAFGGIYLPHLRNAVYNQLIAADNLLDQADGKSGPRVEAQVDDFNFDARQEVKLANDRLTCLIAPATGGQIYELDVHSICHNLLATMTRRPEAYHRKVAAGPSNSNTACGSIHDRVIFKQSGLDQRLQYDSYSRKSLVDHFFDAEATLQDVIHAPREKGDFVLGSYKARLRKSPDRIQVLMQRQGQVNDVPIRITKSVTAAAGSSRLEVTYLLEGLLGFAAPRFAVEWNFAGLPAGLDDRFFYRGQRERLGQLGARLDLRDAQELGLVDEWVSQSEGGFELVHQSVVVMPHWIVEPDAEGRWTVTMSLTVDTSEAEQRMESTTHVAAS
jgi:alpha-amylase